jgi:flagellar biosynthetic protein FliR
METTLVPFALGFLLVLLRTASLFMVAPVFGSKTIPSLVRIGLAVPVAMAAFLGAGAPTFAAGIHPATLLPAAIIETLIGLGTGLSARFFIEAASAAGAAIAMSMGLSFGAMVDPINGGESSALGDLITVLAMATVLSLGIHREIVAWLCHSVILFPPGVDYNIADLSVRVVTDATAAMALSVRLAFPVLAAVTLGHLGLGLLSRVSPQLNLSNVGFTVAILAGGAAFYLIAPMAATMAAQAARTAFARS